MIVQDKTFSRYLKYDSIQTSIVKLGAEIAAMFSEKNPLCIVVMQGAFMFASDVLKQLPFPVELVFIRITSYTGTQGGNITQYGDLPDISSRHVILIEDIVDSGNTLSYLSDMIHRKSAASLFTIALLQKKGDRKISADRVCFEIPDTFVIGYGLDYNGHGRNLKDIWQLQS